MLIVRSAEFAPVSAYPPNDGDLEFAKFTHNWEQYPSRPRRCALCAANAGALREEAVAAQDETKWSFLRRLILAIAAERQKKAADLGPGTPPRHLAQERARVPARTNGELWPQYRPGVGAALSWA
jgi:hypothetical protein